MTNRINYINGVTLLTVLKRRTKLFLSAIVICILLVMAALAFYRDQVIIDIFLAIMIISMGTLLLMITLSYKKLMMGKLIIDNRIMHIRQAQILEEKNHTFGIHKAIGSDLEVFVSCFGILVNSTIVKYNLDGVMLKAVELSDRHITLIYGKELKSEKIRILHETLTLQEMIRIKEIFRYETGVTPVLMDVKLSKIS